MKKNDQGGFVTLGLVQMPATDDPAVNMDKALAKVEEAADRGAQIISLQELYRSRYFPQNELIEADGLAETIPGPSTEHFAAIARERHVVVILPLFEKAADGKFYNSAAVINDEGELLPTYRKVHVPHDPFFYEQNYFAPGDRGYQVYETRYASFSVLICYDQWFPEAARSCVLEGAELLFYPTAIGRIQGEGRDEENWQEAWETIQRSHAIANGVHVAAVNRVGKEDKLLFWGGSFVCDAFGGILQQAGEQEEVLVVEADLSMNRRIREGWGFLKNRRPDTYGKIIR